MSSHATRHFSGAKLREARLSHGLTAEQVARKLDVTYRTVQRWEAAESQPSGHDLVRLSELLGREPGWFYVEREPTSGAAA